METRSTLSQGSRCIACLAVIMAALGAGSCFRTLDMTKIPCSEKTPCPSGYSCVQATDADHGHCVFGNADGARSDQRVSSGLDGQAGSSGSQSADALRDAHSEGLRDLAVGGSGDIDAPVGGAVGGGGATGGESTGGVGGTGEAGGDTGGAIETGGETSMGGTTSSTGGTTSSPDAALAQGAPCTENAQCATALCIDGFCCDKACSGCHACSNAWTGEANGTCASVAVGRDPHETCADETSATPAKPCGNDGTCDGKGACRKVGSGQKCGAASCSTDGTTFTPEPKCDGAGACVPSTAQVCTPYECAVTGCKKTCSTQEQCDTSTSYCDVAAGTCANKKTNGKTATQTYECVSGVIADEVCCDVACTGCNACTAALNGQAASTTGTCMAVTAAKAADPHSVCPAAADPCGMDGTCNGSGACHYATVGSDCGTPSCNSTTSMLTKNSCNQSHVCAAASTDPCPGLMACASTSACKTGACTSPSDCASGYTCISGACTTKLSPGAPCNVATASQCSSGNCVDGHCCNTASCGTCQTCGTSGTCVAVTGGDDSDTCTETSTCNASGVCKKNNGQPCTGGTDCLSTFCSPDGYCCNNQCSGNCQTCNASSSTRGTCQNTTTARTPCGGSGCAASKCNGSSPDCVYVGSEVSCAATCNADLTGYNQALCNGAGSCGSASLHPCSGGTYCSGGSCVGQLPVNSPNCPANAACSTNNCSSNALGSGTMCCLSGQQNCSQGCYDLNTSRTNCRTCGNDCGANHICSSGRCYCVGAEFQCGGCASWNFESGTTEGWYGGTGMTSTTERSVPTSYCNDGNHSLKYRITNQAAATVELCGPGNVTPVHTSGFSYWMYVKTVSGSYSGTTSGELSLVYDSDGNQLGGTFVTVLFDQWFEVVATLDTSDASVFKVNLFSSTPWSADIYIDCVQFTP